MELSEIAASLPNGFHDMRLIALHLNLCDQTAVLEVDVLVGLPDQDVDLRDEYRSASLEFSDAQVLAIDPPHSKSAFRSPGAANIDISENEASFFSKDLLSEFSDQLKIYEILVRDWMANIRIVASKVELKWKVSGSA